MERSVANLTTEQLYRKRALDRVNQRVSRARKKGRIQELEEEVVDLKQRLARSEEQVKQLLGNEASLRQAIESARTSLRLIDAAAATPTGLPTPAPSTATATSTGDQWSPAPLVSSPSRESSHDQRPTALTATSGPILDDSTAAFALTHEDTGLTMGLPFPSDCDSMLIWQDGFRELWDAFFDGCDVDISLASNMASNAFSLSLDSFPAGGDIDTWVSQTADMQIVNLQEPQQLPVWERLPLHVDATCRLDEVVLDLVQSSRQRERNTGPIPELSEQTFPSIKSLLNPERQDVDNSISNAIGQHGRITMQLPNLTDKVAAMYNICTYLRWLISPTKRNYEGLPEFLRPLECQLTTPHPFWIDIVAWPEARLNIMKSMDWSEFLILRSLSNESLTVNWPNDQATIFTAKSKSELRLNPAFENHIRQIRNWTWGPNVAERFPFLKCVPTSLKEPAEQGDV